MNDLLELKTVDSELYDVLCAEKDRQEGTIELIASENFVSQAVLEAVGSVLTNKYAEGLPGNRYYCGCEHVDRAERAAIERAKELFGAEHANVQPYSGSVANMAAYRALVKPGDTVLGMKLEHGGHLTHGSPVNFSGTNYNFVGYGVSEVDELIDYDVISTLAEKHKPALIVAGASAYPRVIDFERIAKIAKDVGAYFMVDMAHIAGLIAAGEHPSPVPHADIVTGTTHKTLRGPRGGMILCKKSFAAKIDKAVFPGLQGGPLMHVVAAKAVCFKEAMSSEFVLYQKQIRKNAVAMADRLKQEGIRLVTDGTDNHLILIDVYREGKTGREAELLLEKAHITTNRDPIPGETLPMDKTSGVRVGTAAVTTRGFKEEDCAEVASLIAMTLRDGNLDDVRARVQKLCKAHPLYN